ncbi:hypothetical protein KP509_05G025100 [Ceratopteris richardii]|uniref:Longin domain-containing protein n=1 Tax=Ceratopteris richardii TaxID=49495 RepID=A0A8T2UK54_CERRI|nr:hypothetical protein KP509_05G025100 [Ceratopteris richardii]
MFRKSAFSTSSEQNNRDRHPYVDPAKPTSSISGLIYYTAVAHSTSILSEYAADGNADLPAKAAVCLEHAPKLHARFSHTTNQRRFICLFDAAATYCAITDEALSKKDGYLFLEKVRDAFKAFGKGRGMSLTLGAHFLDDAMAFVMKDLAASFVGIPQREIDRGRVQDATAQSNAGIDFAINSRSAVAPLHDLNFRNLDENAADPATASKLPPQEARNKGKKGKKTTKQQMNEDSETSKEKLIGGHTNLQAGEAKDRKAAAPEMTHTEAQKRWRRTVSSVSHWISSLA